MRTGRPTPPVVLTAEERQTLEQWARRPTTAQGLAQRARLVLACASSKTNGEIAAAAGVTRQTVGRWRHRFVRKRLPGLLDEPRPGAPRKITDAEVERVIALTLERTPRDATHWSTRAMATALGHRTRTPVRGVSRRALQCERDDTFDLRIGDLARRAGPRLIQQPRQTLANEAMPPAAHGLPRHARGRGDLAVGLARRARQHQTCTLRQSLRCRRAASPLLQRLPFFSSQHDGRSGTASAHRCPPCLHEERRRTPVCSMIFNSGH